MNKLIKFDKNGQWDLNKGSKDETMSRESHHNPMVNPNYAKDVKSHADKIKPADLHTDHPKEKHHITMQHYYIHKLATDPRLDGLNEKSPEPVHRLANSYSGMHDYHTKELDQIRSKTKR